MKITQKIQNLNIFQIFKMNAIDFILFRETAAKNEVGFEAAVASPD